MVRSKIILPLTIKGQIYYSILRIEEMLDAGMVFKEIAELHEVTEFTCRDWYERNRHRSIAKRNSGDDHVQRIKKRTKYLYNIPRSLEEALPPFNDALSCFFNIRSILQIGSGDYRRDLRTFKVILEKVYQQEIMKDV